MSYEEEFPSEERPRRRRRGGAVTAVAVINFVFGGLALVCGCGAIGFGGLFSALSGNPEFKKQIEQAAKQAEKQQGKAIDPQAKEILESGKVGPAVIAAGAIALAIGVAIIIAGIGVIQRRSWGRILTLVLGVLWILASLYPFSIYNLILPVIYCIVVFSILLNSKYAAEFA
jgi:hypothetical protein